MDDGGYSPNLDLRKAMDELGFDPKSPDFSEEKSKAKLLELSENQSIHFFHRDRYKHLVHIMGEHKFWDAQPIMKFREKVKGGK